MAVTFENIKRLKELTGVGVTDAKKALDAAGGDFDKAVEEMRSKGLSKADKKSDREARAGLVDSYVHSERIGVLVEVNCETDFVARTDEFKGFVHDVAMHIAASSPDYLTPEDVPKDVLTKERKIETEALKAEGKPADKIKQILEGKIEKFYERTCLSRQAFIKNPDITVEELTKEMVAKLGENIVVRNMARIELGQRS